jgi:hypothetical protein
MHQAQFTRMEDWMDYVIKVSARYIPLAVPWQRFSGYFVFSRVLLLKEKSGLLIWKQQAAERTWIKKKTQLQPS